MISDFVAGTVVHSRCAVSTCEQPSNSRMHERHPLALGQARDLGDKLAHLVTLLDARRGVGGRDRVEHELVVEGAGALRRAQLVEARLRTIMYSHGRSAIGRSVTRSPR